MSTARRIEILKPALSLIRSLLKRSLPYNRWSDRVFGLVLFVLAHNRMPTKKMLFNDVISRIRNSDEIFNPIRIFVTDKEFVKIFIKAIVGADYNIPTIAVLREEEVDTFDFPKDCCIKPTHLSSHVIFRERASFVDRAKLRSWFRLNHYHYTREANYRYLQPKIIVEPLIFGSTNVVEYRLFCFKGLVKLIQINVDRALGARKSLFLDIDWNYLNFTMGADKIEYEFPKPKNFNQMISVASALAHFFEFVRIDLYSNGQQTFVGEITNCDGNATGQFNPREAEILASRIIFGEE